MKQINPEAVKSIEEQIDQERSTNPAIIEKERLFNVVKGITQFVNTHRGLILEEAHKEQEALLDQIRKGAATQQFLEPPARYLAEKLYDFWAKNVIPPGDILVVEGRCTHLLHQWFEVRGLPEKLEEPNFKYIIDPNPLGISMGYQSKVERVTVVVFEPYSVWQGAYTGKVIRGVEAE